jgi:hypothetical protein
MLPVSICAHALGAIPAIEQASTPSNAMDGHHLRLAYSNFRKRSMALLIPLFWILLFCSFDAAMDTRSQEKTSRFASPSDTLQTVTPLQIVDSAGLRIPTFETCSFESRMNIR